MSFVSLWADSLAAKRKLRRDPLVIDGQDYTAQ